MTDSTHISLNLLLAYSTYAIGSASPGPSNLAVMATAMTAGRKPALVLAFGVISGSLFWGLLAAFGLSAVLATYSGALIAMKILGGCYLLWLASKSARAAWAPASVQPLVPTAEQHNFGRIYLRGAALHLTNPKAIFIWMSIVSLALPPGAEWRDALHVVVGCVAIAVCVFCGYALAFSTASARRVYQSLRRWFEGTLAALFAYAGFRMIASIGTLSAQNIAKGRADV